MTDRYETSTDQPVDLSPAAPEMPVETRAGNQSVDLRKPVAISPGRLLAVVGASLIVAVALVAAVFALVDVRDKWMALMVAGGISLLAALISTVPLLIGARFGLMGAVAGFFGASFLRLVVSVGGCLLAIRTVSVEQVPVLLVMAVLYLAVLAGETMVVGLALYAYQPATLKTSNQEP